MEVVGGLNLRSVMNGGRTSITVEVAYPQNHLEHEAFTEAFVSMEVEKGTIELKKDLWACVTTRDGTHSRRVGDNRGLIQTTMSFISSSCPATQTPLRSLLSVAKAGPRPSKAIATRRFGSSTPTTSPAK